MKFHPLDLYVRRRQRAIEKRLQKLPEAKDIEHARCVIRTSLTDIHCVSASALQQMHFLATHLSPESLELVLLAELLDGNAHKFNWCELEIEPWRVIHFSDNGLLVIAAASHADLTILDGFFKDRITRYAMLSCWLLLDSARSTWGRLKDARLWAGYNAITEWPNDALLCDLIDSISYILDVTADDDGSLAYGDDDECDAANLSEVANALTYVTVLQNVFKTRQRPQNLEALLNVCATAIRTIRWMYSHAQYIDDAAFDSCKLSVNIYYSKIRAPMTAIECQKHLIISLIFLYDRYGMNIYSRYHILFKLTPVHELNFFVEAMYRIRSEADFKHCQMHMETLRMADKILLRIDATPASVKIVCDEIDRAVHSDHITELLGALQAVTSDDDIQRLFPIKRRIQMRL